MNPKYDTLLKVKDMQADKFQLVQNESEISKFNEEYEEDYSYYFIEFEEDTAVKLFGADSIRMHNNVYYVAEL